MALATRRTSDWARDPSAPAAPQHSLVSEVLDEAARRQLARTAFVCGDVSATYSELAELARAAELHLHELGIANGDRVALWAPNSLEWVAWYFGVARARGVLVPLHTRSTSAEAASMLGAVGARVVVIEAGGPGGPTEEHAHALRAEVARSGTVVLDARLPRGSGEPVPASAPRIRSDDTFLAKFTSGSSGTPKGVQLCHEAVVRNGFNAGTRLGLSEEDRLFSPMPFFHSGGSVLTILTAFTHGTAIVTLPRFNGDEAIAAIRDHACTAHIGMEIMYLREIASPAFSREAICSLRTGWIGGSAETAERVYEAMGFPFVNLYGMTEASGNVSMTSLDDPPELRLTWAGIPQPGMEVAVFDPDTDAPLPADVEGEIRVRGWGVMQGYLGEDVDVVHVDDDGWLRTGDSGLIGENGYLKFLGRIRESLKVGGEMVSCAEVEAAIVTHPSVVVAHVVGAPDKVYGELPVAFVQLAEWENVRAEEVVAWCRSRLAGFKVPRHVAILAADEWPLTGPEKVSRSALVAMAEKLVGRDA